MTSQQVFSCPRAADLLSDRFISFVSRRGGPRVQERRGAHQVISNDAEADPARGPISTVIPTASQAMPSFDHTDPAFTADTPALSPAKPPLTLMGTSRGCFASGARE